MPLKVLAAILILAAAARCEVLRWEYPYRLPAKFDPVSTDDGDEVAASRYNSRQQEDAATHIEREIARSMTEVPVPLCNEFHYKMDFNTIADYVVTPPSVEVTQCKDGFTTQIQGAEWPFKARCFEIKRDIQIFKRPINGKLYEWVKNETISVGCQCKRMESKYLREGRRQPNNYQQPVDSSAPSELGNLV